MNCLDSWFEEWINGWLVDGISGLIVCWLVGVKKG